MVYLPLYLENDLGFGKGFLGILIAAYLITTLILVAPLGYLSDRISPKRIIQLGISLVIIYGFSLTSIKFFWGLFIAQIIGGVGESLIVIALSSLYYKHLDVANRGRNVGIYVAAGLLGFAFGPLISGFVLDTLRVSYRGLFLLVAFLGFVLLLFSTFLRDYPPFRIRLLEYKGDILRKEVLLLIVIFLGLGIHFGNERTSYFLYLRNTASLSRLQIGQLNTILGVWMGILSFMIGRLFDRSKKILFFVSVGLAVSGSFHFLTTYFRNFSSILLCRLCHTGGDALAIFSLGVLAASIFPASRMGGNYGFIYLFRTSGGFVGAIISGFLDKMYPSYRISFAMAGGILILAGIFIALNHRTVAHLSKNLSLKPAEVQQFSS